MIRALPVVALIVLACGREGPVDPAEIAFFYHRVVQAEAGGPLGVVDRYWAPRGERLLGVPVPEAVQGAVQDAGGQIVPAAEWDACRRALRREEICPTLRRLTVIQIEEPTLEEGVIRAALLYTYTISRGPCVPLFYSSRVEYRLRGLGPSLEAVGYRLAWKHDPPRSDPDGICG